MPRDDAVRAIDQHRVVEPELPDRARDQRHLRLAVRARVVGIGDQIGEWTVDYCAGALGHYCNPLWN